MPLQIDISSIDLNVSNTGFSANYLPVLPIDEPSNCQLPSLVAGNFSLPTTPLTSVNAGCSYQFTTVFPTPPPFAPKPIPPICPTGGDFSGTVSLIGTGAVKITNGSIALSGGPCNGTLIGGPTIIDVPEIPCPLGTSFSGNALITTSGIASGGGTINVTGGPCGFTITGLVDIYVPPTSAGSAGGGNVGAQCQDCSKTCCDVRTAIENQYSTLGTTPKLGDIIDVCVAVFEVVGNPNPTSNCDGSCPSIAVATVIDFAVGGTTYFARKLSSQCPSTPFFVTINKATNKLLVMPGVLQTNLNPGSSYSISGLNTYLSFSSTDVVYLQLGITNYTVSSANIYTGSGFNVNAAPWTTGSIAENDGGTPPSQTIARYLIANINNGIAQQCCVSNLIAAYISIEGLPGVYPQPL